MPPARGSKAPTCPPRVAALNYTQSEQVREEGSRVCAPPSASYSSRPRRRPGWAQVRLSRLGGHSAGRAQLRRREDTWEGRSRLPGRGGSCPLSQQLERRRSMAGAPVPRRPPGACLLAAGSLLLALWPAAAVDIYTPGTLEALNGTDARLKCTFSSSDPVGARTTVTWHFRPQEGGTTEFVLHYHGEAFPPKSGRFSGRVTWDGNVAKNDASIRIWGLSPTDNGTFQCQVKNPPDVDGVLGEIQLSVVLRVNFSEIHILAITIGSACALMILIVITIVVCRHRRRTRHDKEMEMVEAEPEEKEKLKASRGEVDPSEPREV